jgi:CRISPR/Cas system-associated exonuclease Cas4 (RecB family)
LKIYVETPVETPDEKLAEQFVTILDNTIEQISLANLRPGSNYYKPSSMQCIRQSWFIRNETGSGTMTNAPDSQLTHMAGIGSYLHAEIQDALSQSKDFGFNVEWIDPATYVEENGLTDLEVISKGDHETKFFNKRLSMSFLCDGILKINDEYYILEIKTEGSSKFFKRNWVDSAHLMQGFSYSLNFKIPKVLFLYMSRDMCGKKSYVLNVTDEDRAKVSDHILTCEKYLEEDELPPKPEGVDLKKLCQYCQYKRYC